MRRSAVRNMACVTGMGIFLISAGGHDLLADSGRSAEVPAGAVREQAVRLRTERAELLDTYREFEKRQFPDPTALTGTALHQYLVLRGGIRAEESAIDWLDEVTAALEGNDDT